jgi:Reverse transcriptase (RNA-dependent DNA polymerase)
MKACIVKAGLWEEQAHSEALKAILEDCACNLAKNPKPYPRVSLSSTHKGEELCIDIIYLEGVPHLHAEDKYTAFSACSKLANRLISEQIATLSNVWITPHGTPKRITADSEYDKAEFRAFCDGIDCDLVITATEAHHQNGTIEAGNRILRMFYRRIRMAERQLTPLQAVENAVYGKNCCTGSKGSSSYELWFGNSPKVTEISPTLKAAYDAKQARTRIFRAIRPGHRGYEDVKVGEYVQFFREKKGWSTPCIVVSVSRNIVTVIHNNLHKTAARSSIIPCDPPFSVFLDTDDCILEPGNGTGIPDGGNHSDIPLSDRNVVSSGPNDASSAVNNSSNEPATETDTSTGGPDMAVISATREVSPTPVLIVTPLSDAASSGRVPRERPVSTTPSDRVLRSRATNPTESVEGHNLTDRCTEHLAVVEFRAAHFITTMPFTRSSHLASSEDMADAYVKEKQNWLKASAYKVIDQANLPRYPNIIGSHVIYKYKPDGTLKARIVPHGHTDDEKAFLRTDAPTMSVEVMRLLVSMAAERGWRLGSLDIKAAYLQASGFDREIFVRPPKEEADSIHLWQLEKPAYGLVESGRLWFLTAFKALEAHELQPCPYDKTLFKLKDCSLFVTTQVDNFIFTGTDRAMNGFSAYMSTRFELSELDFDNFSVCGTVFRRDRAGIHIGQRENITELVEYPLARDRRRMHDEPVTRAERLFYMSTVGSMLFVGRVTSPIVARMAGVLASALPFLAVKDIKTINAAIRRIKTNLPSIAELHFMAPSKADKKPDSFLLVFTDASFHEEATRNRAGVLVTRSFGLDSDSPAHVIDFCSHKLRRVARSTKTAETLAASEGYDRAYYIGAVLAWMEIRHGLFMVLDSSSLFADVSSTRTPKEKRLKVDLALLRESFENGDLGAVIWAETTAQLADAMTKADEKADSRMLLALSEGVLRYPYRDCLTKVSPVFGDLNGAKGGVVKDTQSTQIVPRH